tara:strand:- start:314 stop:571 length:258 start_codon:yes stop_codon:yes gene_type:complete
MIDFNKMTRQFLLNEGEMPDIDVYLQSLHENLNSMNPKTVSGQRRLRMAQKNLNEIRRQVRRMNTRINTLEEQITVLEENKAANE